MSLLSLLGGVSGSPITTIPAQGVDLDGVLDYWSRSSDLTGNVDSKTFTFSAWVYSELLSQSSLLYIEDGTTFGLVFYVNTSGQLFITGRNSTPATILNANTSTGSIPKNTFCHILASIDMANTANRSIYINDVLQTVTWGTYTNSTLDLTKNASSIGSNYAGSAKLKGRLQSVFLDYTYRDLSIESNRRLFIDANGKPADGWKALSPIIGMSMKDAATAHINDYGTGGNFTPNGTYATSNRGANQDNCVASYFDGVADYLRKDNIIASPTSTFIVCGAFSTKNVSARIMQIGTTTTAYALSLQYDTSGILFLSCKNSSNVAILEITVSNIVQNKTYAFQISSDMSDQNKLRVLLNGIVQSPTVSTFTSGNINIVSGSTDITIGCRIDNTLLFNGNIGELYFDTTYIDLATNNPFWDATENRPKPVRQVIRETGVTPFIAMPLDASNAGKNYGAGGDFTVNSGPYVGARGASEFWARSAKFDGTTGYLSRGALTGAVDSKTFSLVLAVNNTTSNYPRLLHNGVGISVSINTSNQLVITGQNVATNNILVATTTTTIPTGGWYILEICIDLANTANRAIYINGGLATTTWTTYTNDTLDITTATWTIGADVGLGNKLTGNIASCYFTTDYIDFSQEVNRLKFVDAFNMPLDLASQINKGIIPNPLIYLPFSDTSNFGKNLGTGGDFVVNGSITAGADVNG